MTALTAVIFVQLYRANVLLVIVRPIADTTPDTLEEVIAAVEASRLRLAFSGNSTTTEYILLAPNMDDDQL